jgi:DNA anti-recombination protein RmuC
VAAGKGTRAGRTAPIGRCLGGRRRSGSTATVHKRCATFLESYSKVGRQLSCATEAYNSSVGSLEGRVLPQLRRFEELGAGSEQALAPPKAIDGAARVMVAPELDASVLTVQDRRA